MLVLGIESSCDETAAAVISDDRRILSNVILSQTNEHTAYGGVVPEVAARAHINHIEDVIDKALAEANTTLERIDAIAVTGGPGLIGGVIVGVMTAKALSSVHKKPYIAVNHLEGHALTVRLTNDIPFPYLLLLVSGGHCQFLAVEGVGKYKKLGGTVDDALGEAFDKVAKMLGLGYPGGPAVEQLARSGNETAYKFPVPMKGREGCDFSFSGLKTAVRKCVMELEASGTLTEQAKADICASFQYTVVQSLTDRAHHAIQTFRALHPEGKHFVLAGGVAANQYIRGALQEVISSYGLELVAPPIKLCTDNAAMIAWAGIEHLKLGNTSDMAFEPKARWPLAHG
ncbi:MAG: tRNA (adenosine(37)-N6)-threonylcarbamoyltransferase complex transferase subunit TsaD [Alphaproteobacteria bacterium]